MSPLRAVVRNRKAIAIVFVLFSCQSATRPETASPRQSEGSRESKASPVQEKKTEAPSHATNGEAASTPAPAPAPAPAPTPTPKQSPAPSFDACTNTELNPDCAKAFPAQVKCPHAFTDVPLGAYCGLVGVTEAPSACTYPQGVCTCANTPYCGGAAPTHLQQAGMKWTCRPPRKPDDCPDIASNGKECSTEGKQCAYGSCGSTTRCKCTNGKYKCATQHWAPPP